MPGHQFHLPAELPVQERQPAIPEADYDEAEREAWRPEEGNQNEDALELIQDIDCLVQLLLQRWSACHPARRQFAWIRDRPRWSFT